MAAVVVVVGYFLISSLTPLFLRYFAYNRIGSPTEVGVFDRQQLGG